MKDLNFVKKLNIMIGCKLILLAHHHQSSDLLSNLLTKENQNQINEKCQNCFTIKLFVYIFTFSIIAHCDFFPLGKVEVKSVKIKVQKVEN